MGRTIFNMSCGWQLRRTQARRRVEQGLSAWVEFDHSIRDLTLEERVKFRSQSAERPTLPFAELFGVHYEPSEANRASHQEELSRMKEANDLAKKRGQQ